MHQPLSLGKSGEHGHTVWDRADNVYPYYISAIYVPSDRSWATLSAPWHDIVCDVASPAGGT